MTKGTIRCQGCDYFNHPTCRGGSQGFHPDFSGQVMTIENKL